MKLHENRTPHLPAATPTALPANDVFQPFAAIHVVTAAIGWALAGGNVDVPAVLYYTSDGGAQ